MASSSDAPLPMATVGASAAGEGSNSLALAAADNSARQVATTDMDDEGAMRPVLQNIVATCNLAVELDLKVIALHARNAEYNPKRFAAVIMRIRDPKTTALIFKSGKPVNYLAIDYCLTSHLKNTS